MQQPPLLFALNASRTLGQRVAERLGVPLSPHEEREFEDGEHKTRPLVGVRDRDVYVLQSLHGDATASVNDRLVRLLFFLGTLRDASAARLTALVPYLAYARKDVRTQPRDPVLTRYTATLFEAVGVDRIVAFEVHNPVAFENAFRCRTEHLDTGRLFADYFHDSLAADAPLVVVSPDAGGAKRAERLRRALAARRGSEVSLALLPKVRARGEVTTGPLAGDVAGANVVVIDDLISTGTTLRNAAAACRAAGARRVYAAAAHGLFTADARTLFEDHNLDRVIVTDSTAVRLDPALTGGRLTILSIAGLYAQAVRRLHAGGSLVELLHE